MTMALHIYKPRGFQRTWLHWIGHLVAEFWRPQYSRSPYHAHGHDHYASMGKWRWRCTSTSQNVSKSLIWSESPQLLLSSGVHKIPEALITYSSSLITPMDMPMWPQWTNGHHSVHLEAWTVPVNLTWFGVNQSNDAESWAGRTSVWTETIPYYAFSFEKGGGQKVFGDRLIENKIF